MAAVEQQEGKINNFLAKQMLKNSKTDDEIQALRTTACVQVNIQGQHTELLSIEGLENRFNEQQDLLTRPRVCVPSTDILEWKTKFPLIETCPETQDDMLKQYSEI